MLRREFLAGILKSSAFCPVPSLTQRIPEFRSSLATKIGRLVGVCGEIRPSDVGIMLPHEHIMSLYGAQITDTEAAVYDREALFSAVVPYLKRLRKLCCRTIADCTTAYFGRAPALLREISEATGMNILTNTGYYGASNDRYVPPHAYQVKAEDLARVWISEFEKGIADSGIRPGFIKIAVDPGRLSEIDRKIVRAAALTHLETGLTIASHTGGSAEAVSDQLEILAEEGVDYSAWIWVHAHAVDSPDLLVQYAGRRVWIELDGITPKSMERDLRYLAALKKKRLLSRVLLSHDGNSFRFGGKPPNPYEALFTHFIPFLAKNGFSSAEIRLLVEQNPARAFTVKVRAA